MAKKTYKKEKVVEKAIVEDEPVKVIEEAAPEPVAKQPFRRLVAAGGEEWYVDADGKKFED